MGRRLFTLAAVVSLVTCVAVCVLLVRARDGADEAQWRQHRRRADGGVGSTEVDLTLGRRIGVVVRWADVPPRSPSTDDLFYYYVSADRSGGAAHFTVRRRLYKPGPDSDAYSPEDYDSEVYAGWGPVRWFGEDR